MITSPPPSRYTVKMLLNHEFFAEGVKIEALSHQGDETEDSPLLHLRMEVPTKEVSRKNNQESIEFTYDLDKDQPEVVISKMVSLVRSCLEKMVAIFAPIFSHCDEVGGAPRGCKVKLPPSFLVGQVEHTARGGADA